MDLTDSDIKGDASRTSTALLDLPREIRRLIYQQLFSNQSLTVAANMRFDWPKITASQNLCVVPSPRNVSIAILLTCRQCYQEGREVLYQLVDYVFVESPSARSHAFNRFGYEYFDYARTRIRKIWGFPTDCVHGKWIDLLFDRFPELTAMGLEFDTIVPVAKIREPGAHFPVMSDERLLNAVHVLRKTYTLDKALRRIRSERPNLKVYATFNFIVGHVDEDKQLHMMMLIEMVNQKIVKTLYEHTDCLLRVIGEGSGKCYMRIAWSDVLDALEGKHIHLDPWEPSSHSEEE